MEHIQTELGLDISVLVLCVIIGFLISIGGGLLRHQQRTIERQNETIQRLVSRDLPSHTDTGNNPASPDRTVYAAWGNQMVNIDEDERQ